VIADTNGDGLMDLVWLNGWQVYIRLNSTTPGAAVPAFAASFGLAATLPSVGGGNFGAIPTIVSRLNASGLRRHDFDGDGRQDLYYISIIPPPSGGPGPSTVLSRTMFSRGTTFDVGADVTSGSDVIAVNFNDDACTDRLVGATVFIEKCDNTASSTVGLPATPLMVMDWDGDRRTDFLVNNGGMFGVYRSTGNTVSTLQTTSIPYTAGGYFAIDQDGDGLEDLARVSSAAPYGVSYYTHTLSGGSTFFETNVPDLATAFTDGYGINYSPGYVSTAQNSYTLGSGTTFPLQDATSAILVVGQVTSSDGTGATYNKTYSYFAARNNLMRNQFAGFGARTETDGRNGLIRKTSYEQLFPLTGFVKSSEALQPGGTTQISLTTNTYSSIPLGAGNDARFLPYLSQSVATRKEVGGGTFNGVLLSTTTTTNSVDSATGALTDTTISVVEAGTANGLQSGIAHAATIHHTLFNDFVNNCFGQPETTTQTRSNTISGSATITRTTGRSWSGQYCRPTQSVVEPGSVQWQVTTDFGYDGFGNVNLLTVTPATGQGQDVRTSSTNWGTTGQFPESATNPKSQTAIYGWNGSLGVLSSITDPNGIVVSWDLDAYGRAYRENRPDGTDIQRNFVACNAGNSYCGAASDVRYMIENLLRDTMNVAIRTDTQYFDGFDRPRYAYQQMLSGANSGTITQYDSLGRIASQSTPFVSSDPIWYTSYAYDLLSRPTLIQRQASESDATISATQFDYQGLSRITTDPLNHSSTQVFSAIGQVIKAIDAAGNRTDYEYDAFSNLLKTRDAYNNEITLTYNVRGMKMTSSDPDMGAWSYNYFPLGELKSQTDAKNLTTIFTYDALSRPLTRVEPDASLTATNWTWDTATNGIGQLASVSFGGGSAEAYTFDTLGRLTQTRVTNDAIAYDYSYTYQGTTGLLDTLTYPVSIASERFKVRYAYQYGLLTSVQSYIGNVAGTMYWQSTGTNARGQTVLEQFGNGLQTSSTYDRLAGHLDSRATGPSASGTIQNLAYRWNKVGSLTERKDLNQSLTEEFAYDNLDRLDFSKLNGSINLDLAYDAIGNIISKSDVGTYAYHATRKHAVISTTGAINNTYGYDANGNMTSRNGFATTWTTYNYPSRIIQSSTLWTDFRYGINRQLRWQSITTNGNVESWWYIGRLLEKRQVGPNYEYRHIIYGADGPVAVRLRTNGGSSTYYLTSDHLGSTNAVTGSGATTLVNESFDAFGKRRGSNWTGVPSAADNTQINASTKHGFTFHEHLTNLGLINMQGRVFDPVIGRFMSADPYIQAPLHSQSLNRYSYTFNNPLSYTDQSGFACGTITENDENGNAPGQICQYPDSPDYSDYTGDPYPPADVDNSGSGGDGGHQSTPTGPSPDSTVGGTQILDTITAPWGGWDDFKYSVRCTWECDMPGNGSLEANLAALPFIPVVGVEAATARLGSKLYDIIPYWRTAAAGFQKHHGVLDAWARANILGYRSGAAPAVVLSIEQHNATRAVFNTWRAEQGWARTPLDWSRVSPQQMQALTYRMFEAAGVPKDVMNNYFRAFDEFLYGF
jgi:RHS repeat-associated protein